MLAVEMTDTEQGAQMTPEQLWEKYRGHLMLEHEFLAALKEYGEAVRAENVCICGYTYAQHTKEKNT